MYLNKTNLFLVTNICLIFFLLSYNDVNSEEVKIISGIAKVTDGDTIRIEEKKIRFYGIDAPEKKNSNVKKLGYLYLLYRLVRIIHVVKFLLRSLKKR